MSDTFYNNTFVHSKTNTFIIGVEYLFGVAYNSHTVHWSIYKIPFSY